jgi:AcrR family transcriptional regulator
LETNVDRIPNVDEGEAAREGARPRRRLTQAEAKERTRQELVAAAARVFAQKGFAGASLEEIAEAAGYSTGAVYYNFAGKEELFLELIRSGWARQIERRTEAVTRVFAEAAADGGDPFDTLSAFLAGRAGQGSDVSPLVAEFWLYAVRHPEVMDLVAAKLSEQDRGLEPVIAEAMERYGTPEGISPAELTLVAMSLFEGLARRRRMDKDAVPDDLFARVLRRLFGVDRRTETQAAAEQK